jgi:A nuclease family of the HNH/ENDO VII superfamily with conserved AHH
MRNQTIIFSLIAVLLLTQHTAFAQWGGIFGRGLGGAAFGRSMAGSGFGQAGLGRSMSGLGRSTGGGFGKSMSASGRASASASGRASSGLGRAPQPSTIGRMPKPSSGFGSRSLSTGTGSSRTTAFATRKPVSMRPSPSTASRSMGSGRPSAPIRSTSLSHRTAPSRAQSSFKFSTGSNRKTGPSRWRTSIGDANNHRMTQASRARTQYVSQSRGLGKSGIDQHHLIPKKHAGHDVMKHVAKTKSPTGLSSTGINSRSNLVSLPSRQAVGRTSGTTGGRTMHQAHAKYNTMIEKRLDHIKATKPQSQWGAEVRSLQNSLRSSLKNGKLKL